MKPFIKFPGGKSYLAETIISRFPEEYKNYHEPMLGGGAIFIELAKQGRLRGKKAYISDANLWLMHMYRSIANEPEKIIQQLGILKEKHRKCVKKYGSAEKFYYYVRKTINHDFCAKKQLPEASIMIYLNKTCFNGLFRFNSRGLFNAPFGKQENPTLCVAKNILVISRALRKYVIFGLPDYRSNFINVKKNDLVYYDPPYWPVKEDSFVGYNQNKFSKENHAQLANFAKDLAEKRGAHVVLSNADTPEVRKLYKKFNIYKVAVPRRINRDGEKRGKVYELIITSF